MYIEDVRLSGHCVSGARRWFNEHGLDFREFRYHGIDPIEFVTFGDTLALRVAIQMFARRLRAIGASLHEQEEAQNKNR